MSTSEQESTPMPAVLQVPAVKNALDKALTLNRRVHALVDLSLIHI